MNKRKFEHNVFSRPRNEKGYLQPVLLAPEIQKGLERICAERVGKVNAKEEEIKIRRKASSLSIRLKQCNAFSNLTTEDVLTIIVRQDANCYDNPNEPLDFHKHEIRGNTHLAKIFLIDDKKEYCLENVKLVCWRPFTLTEDQQSQLRKIISKNFALNEDKEITTYVNNLRKIIRQRIKSARDQRLGIVEIDLHWGLVTYINQSGLCYYSKRILQIVPGAIDKEDLISKERLNPSIGYTKENTVWCGVQYNGPQQFSRELKQAFTEGESKPVTENSLERVSLVLQKTVKIGAKIQTRQVRNDGKWYCKNCQDWKVADDFYMKGKFEQKRPYSYCKICTKLLQNENFSVLPGFFPVLMSFCTVHMKNKQKNLFSMNKKRVSKGLLPIVPAENAFDFSLDKVWFVKQFVEIQKGRCAVSNHPLDIKRGSSFSVSIERSNESIGYTPQNCVLICSFFQNGQCQWTREMFVRNFLNE